ncbi:site-specific integrase [uncultured Sneathiella sp.]|jgi:integrase|uniref:tyrosine-type recombinase/integrase n=1 Tax=uncultured Sneathiella sp. TaxID=879315 RepID=UPI0030D6ECFD|tara:strand:- start:577 stop:1659 length:1083 start_codon:yes stop_codon:yes gene_type:complete
MATISKRVSKSTGKVSYKVQVRKKGRPPLTATFEKKTDAKKWAADKEAEINQSKHFGYSISKKINLHDVIERYIKEVLSHKSSNTIRGQKAQLGWWQSELGKHSISDISVDLVLESQAKLQKQVSKQGNQVSNSTINRYLSALSNVFTVAIKEWSYANSNPLSSIRKLPEPKPRARFLSDSEREALLKSCKESASQYLYPIVILTLATGARKSEILKITWEHVHLDQDIIVIPETKNGTTHTLALSDISKKILISLRKSRNQKCPWIFPNKDMDGPIDIRKAFETAVKNAQLEDFKFHDLRHTAASYLAMNGATTVELAAALNHKSLQMVHRYAHLSKPHSANVLSSMNAKYLGDEDVDA